MSYSTNQRDDQGKCYYSEKQRMLIRRFNHDNGPVTNWWLTRDGKEVEVTSVDTEPPRFDDVVFLGYADKWLRSGE